MKLIALLGIVCLTACSSGDARVAAKPETTTEPEASPEVTPADLSKPMDEPEDESEVVEEPILTDEEVEPEVSTPVEEPEEVEEPVIVDVDVEAPEHNHDHEEDATEVQEEAQEDAPESYLEAGGPAATDGGGNGTVRGKITFEGKRPSTPEVTITDKASVHCTTDGAPVDPTNRSLLVDQNGGISNVVVTIAVKGAEVVVPEDPIHIDQLACRYEPHVMLIPKGATIKYLNSDKVSHNVHTYPGRNDALNKTVAPGSSEQQVLRLADKVELKCDIHPWMNAWMFVTDDPYTTTTAPDGSFSIAGVPPGKYKAELWHELLGTKKRIEVIVNEDGTSQPLNLTMGKSNKPRRGR